MVRRPIQRRPPDAIGEASRERIEENPAARAVRWNLILIWFMRLLALAWIAKGLIAWASILGIHDPSPPFEARSSGYQATVIYFAVIDLVAAVGLWLTSTWGGVLWLLAVMSHLILAVFFPRVVAGGPIVIAVFVICIGLYLTISWLAVSDDYGPDSFGARTRAR